jgi:hypothetical protein
MSAMLNSINTEFAERSVSVSMPGKALLSKPGDECTSTFLRSRDALGNFLRNDKLTDSNSYLVEMLLLRDLRIIPATLSCMRKEAIKRITVTAITTAAIIFRIL